MTSHRLLVCALAAGCSQPPPRDPVPRPATVSSDAPTLRRYDGAAHEAPTLPATARNPFQYGRESARSGAERGGRALPPPEGLPELPLPLPQPPLRLLGLVTTRDGHRVAVITVGSDLVLARTGELLANRFTVNSIGDDEVVLTDAIGDRTMRLRLP